MDSVSETDEQLEVLDVTTVTSSSSIVLFLTFGFISMHNGIGYWIIGWTAGWVSGRVGYGNV